GPLGSGLFRSKHTTSQKNFYDNLTSTLLRLSTDKIGAIIAIENQDSLESYVNIGYRVTSDFSPELLVTIFYNKQSPLHDGAVIVRDYQIVSVSSYFPMTRQLIDVSYGSRHRSALGLTEKCDAIVFIVSETTGKISVAVRGVIKTLSSNSDRLQDQIIHYLTVKPG
uniref:Diadenylate cyclase n=1 Tax=Mycoplasmoides pneumoniae 19294 TaxID=1213463 RepID=UPI00255C2817|nr:Chain A, Diadenylate cyclase [Mycoplasmoides pneumoniae 19294]8OFJ_B Chain B, Diadenylate cyclase [Mycoplasmoides pneumoniae 19294]